MTAIFQDLGYDLAPQNGKKFKLTCNRMKVCFSPCCFFTKKLLSQQRFGHIHLIGIVQEAV